MAATLLLALAALVWGSVPLDPGEVWTHLRGGEASPTVRAILGLRLDRLALTIVTGSALAVCGVAMQAILRNPLADPYVLGTSSGAACGAACALALGITAELALPCFGFAGGALSTLLVYAIARRGPGLPRERLLLAGVIVGFLLGAVIMLLMTLSQEMLQSIVAVLMGNLDYPFSDASRQAFVWTSIVVALAMLVVMAFVRTLDALALGDEAAAHLGVAVDRVRLTLFLVCALLVGAVVAFTGLIGFVGLVVPHAVRLLVGPEHRRLLPLAALGGAGLLIAADLLSRALTPSPLPVGVVTALLGGPFFLFLLKRQRGRR